MQHCQMSDRYRRKLRETTPRQVWRPPTSRQPYPAVSTPLQAWPQSRSNRGSLQEASVGRQPQDLDGSFSSYRVAPSSVLRQNKIESLGAKAPLEHIALEGETTKLKGVLPPQSPEQLDRDKLELDDLKLDSCTPRGQLERALAAMHQAVRSLSAKLGGQEPTNDDDNNTNDDNNNNHTNNNNNNTTNNNNNNNEPQPLQQQQKQSRVWLEQLRPRQRQSRVRPRPG